MSDTAHKNADTPTSRPRRPIVVRLLRFLAFSGFGLLILLAALIGFSETDTFRSLLRDLIIDAAESSLNGQLEISSISGNLFTGWELREVSLTDDAGSILEVESIVLRYNFFRAPWKRITIRELTLNTPRISITRAEGRDWNISTLIPPSEDEDTTTTPFDWVIVVENLRILNGTLLVYDSTVTEPLSTTRLDANRLLFEKMHLALSLTVAPEEMSLTLNRCSWSNEFGEVGMQNLSGDIALRDTSLVIEGLSVQTERSALLLSASIEGVDLLSDIDEDVLRRMRVDVRLDAPTVEIRDLQYFLPSLDFLGATARLDLDFRGSFNQLHIKKLRLDALESSLLFSGELRNILDGSEMTIDAVSEGTVIHAGDIPVFLPGIPVMDLSGLGRVRFNSLLYSGTPLRFNVEMDMESDAGDIAGNMFMDLSGNELLYEATLRTRNFDPGRALNNSALAGALNLRTSIRGQGTELGKMEAAVSLNGDSTRFRGNLAHMLQASLEIERDSLHLDMQSALGTSTISVQGGMSFRADTITGFRLVADARNLDLAPLLDDEELSSDLNFALVAHGDGIDLSTASGEVEIMLEPSWLKELRIDQDTFFVELRQSVNEPELLLVQSQYADVRLEGEFDLPRFATYMTRQLDSLSGAFARYTLTPDIGEETETGAARGMQVTPVGRVAAASPADPREAEDDSASFMDLRYTLTLKNPERIARYFDASTFLLRGSWRGSIVGGVRGFDIDGEVALSDFYFVDSLRTWLAAGLRCTYEIRDLQLQQPLEHLLLSTRISAGDLHIDGMRLSRTLLEFDWRDAAPMLHLRSLIDTLAQIDLTASARHVDYGYDITLPKLELLYRGDAWRNQRQIQLRIDSAGMDLRSFDIGNGAMRLSASGQRSTGGENNFTVYADSLEIEALEYMLTGDGAAREGKSFSGVGFVEARLTGDDSAPLLAADIFIDDLGFRGAHFGRMTLESRYSESMLELYSELIYQTQEGEEEKVFFVSGSLPVGISLTGEEEEVSGEAIANLRVQMRDFPLTLTEEFLGLFSPLTGTANADITVSGTAETPSFTGFLTVSDGRGRFLFNNLEYELGLRIEAIKQDIRIIDLSIANIPSDWSD
ncbi:MAG: hypothetical protein KFH87_08220, partial [Bacteroidetes bacterium]|nr:hypothetical protein [Bacteroidota bacterium]